MTYNDIYRITTPDSIHVGQFGNKIFDNGPLIQVFWIDSSEASKFVFVYLPIYDYEYIGSNDLLTYINEL